MRTPTWRSRASTCSPAISMGSMPTTSRTRRKPKLIASVVCPGGQGDVSVYGNLLFMSVEQTRGRSTAALRALKRRSARNGSAASASSTSATSRKPKQVAAVQTCRGSHTHTLVTVPNDKENLYVYGSGTGTRPVRRRARRLLRTRSEGRPQHRALQHRRDPGADRGAGEGTDREPPAHLRRCRHRGDRRPVAGREPGPGHPDLTADQPVP